MAAARVLKRGNGVVSVSGKKTRITRIRGIQWTPEEIAQMTAGNAPAKKPKTENRQPATGNRKPATDKRQRTTNNGQPATGKKRKITGVVIAERPSFAPVPDSFYRDLEETEARDLYDPAPQKNTRKFGNTPPPEEVAKVKAKKAEKKAKAAKAAKAKKAKAPKKAEDKKTVPEKTDKKAEAQTPDVSELSPAEKARRAKKAEERRALRKRNAEKRAKKRAAKKARQTTPEPTPEPTPTPALDAPTKAKRSEPEKRPDQMGVNPKLQAARAKLQAQEGFTPRDFQGLTPEEVIELAG